MNLMQMLGLAERLSDQQLTMASKSGSMPEFIALAELHRRNGMRDTQEPASLRDELMAKAEAPGMAAGGLVRVHDTRPMPLGGERRYFSGFQPGDLGALPSSLRTAITGSPGTTSPLVASADPAMVGQGSSQGGGGGWDGNPNSGPGRDGNPDSKPGTGNVVNDLSSFASGMRGVVGSGPLAQTAMGFLAGGIPGAIAGGALGMIGGTANVAGGRAVSAASEVLGGRPTNATGILGSISQALGLSDPSDGRAKGDMDPSIQGNADVTGGFDKPGPSNIGATVDGVTDGSGYGKGPGVTDGGDKAGWGGADAGGKSGDIGGFDGGQGPDSAPGGKEGDGSQDGGGKEGGGWGGGENFYAGGPVDRYAVGGVVAQQAPSLLARVFRGRVLGPLGLAGAGAYGAAHYGSSGAPDGQPERPARPVQDQPQPAPARPAQARQGSGQAAPQNDDIPFPPPSPPGEGRDRAMATDSQRKGLSPMDIAMIQIGLGMMGSNKRSPLEAMSQAAAPALRTYAELTNAEERRDDRAAERRDLREWREQQLSRFGEDRASREAVARERLNRTAGRAPAAPRPRADMTDEQWQVRIAAERDPAVRQRLIEARAASRGGGETDRLGMRTP